MTNFYVTLSVQVNSEIYNRYVTILDAINSQQDLLSQASNYLDSTHKQLLTTSINNVSEAFLRQNHGTFSVYYPLLNDALAGFELISKRLCKIHFLTTNKAADSLWSIVLLLKSFIADIFEID
jgi:hypothetical protein